MVLPFLLQVVYHPSDVSSLLCVQNPQHRIRCADKCEPLHWHQWQRGHLCPGALHQQCKSPQKLLSYCRALNVGISYV